MLIKFGEISTQEQLDAIKANQLKKSDPFIELHALCMKHYDQAPVYVWPFFNFPIDSLYEIYFKYGRPDQSTTFLKINNRFKSNEFNLQELVKVYFRTFMTLVVG